MIEFIEPIQSRAIGVTYMLIAWAYLQFVLPAMIPLGRWHILKFWCFALALGSFGLGRLFGPIYLETNAWIFAIGHYGLITYAALRLLGILREHKGRWRSHHHAPPHD
ncbi:hypothetical protein [Novosphingopyxis sp. YJ-S2-01]|uniref:hypothetical protein n=1 Tax=Novosphingopyxis sp. YJ-S2-01 TaxID=2794021 RepID=UPI0018DE0A17|nr:hypothetical protein [Novosphingopyxis sp. YJ-S2-01]MBH9536933.1 hypothetical protein [Novosphingopyxis sp. YJ-S2-01]